MNTPRSVFYGWGALIVATGFGYYFAKKENEKRWSEQRARGLRLNGPTDWKDKIAQATNESEMPADAASGFARSKLDPNHPGNAAAAGGRGGGEGSQRI